MNKIHIGVAATLLILCAQSWSQSPPPAVTGIKRSPQCQALKDADDRQGKPVPGKRDSTYRLLTEEEAHQLFICESDFRRDAENAQKEMSVAELKQQIEADRAIREERVKQLQADKAQKEADAATVGKSARARRAGLPSCCHIGMTEDEVLRSHLGQPYEHHSTTTAAGTLDQWFYGGEKYLYFKNGVLVGIQE